MINQWQFVLQIAEGREPEGWVSSGKVSGDREWYEIWNTGDQAAIDDEVDRMLKRTL